jgi:hypothetical protein
MAAKADEAVNSWLLFVLPEVFAEVVYVLTKVYGIERSDVADSMIELLDFVSSTATTRLVPALGIGGAATAVAEQSGAMKRTAEPQKARPPEAGTP